PALPVLVGAGRLGAALLVLPLGFFERRLVLTVGPCVGFSVRQLEFTQGPDIRELCVVDASEHDTSSLGRSQQRPSPLSSAPEGALGVNTYTVCAGHTACLS